MAQLFFFFFKEKKLRILSIFKDFMTQKKWKRTSQMAGFILPSFPMRWLNNIILIISISFFILSCDDTPKHQDTLGKGAIDISVDETYRPVTEEQIKVFDSIYPEAHITIHYKPEAECFKDY